MKQALYYSKNLDSISPEIYRKKRRSEYITEWQKNHRLEVAVKNYSLNHRDKLIIIYECACDIPFNSKQNHHPDYSKPLEILKLCPACHSTWHKKVRIKKVS
jgi:hypothetical protein